MQRDTAISPRPAASDSGPTTDELLTGGRFALGLALLILAAFPQVLLGLETFVVRDYGFFAYPLAHLQREYFWSGELPFWNPYNNCGVPFLAQWNTMPLYPPALVYLVLPLPWSLSFFCLVHLYFAGLGMYWLAYRWTGHRTAAAIAGVAFAFNGLSLNMLMWPSHIATLSWMPWVVLCVESAWRLGGRHVLLAAAAGTLQMLAGGPETILLTWLLCLGLLGASLAAPGSDSEKCEQPLTAGKQPASRSRMVLRFGLMVALVAGLAAIQLVPFLHLAANSQREQGFADTRWSLPAWGWVNYLVPLVFGRVWNMGVFFQHEQSWTSSYYLGMGPLLLALAGAGWNRDRRSRVLLVACVAAFALALGDQLILNRWLRAVLPQLSLVTYPVKFVTVIAFAAPLLAAGAYACLGRPSNGTPDGKLAGKLFGLALILGLLIGAILAWARQSPFPTDNLSLTLKSSLTRAGFLAIAAAILLLKVRLARRPWPVLLPLVLIAVFWLDVWTHAPNQNPSVPPWVYQAGLARTKLELQPPPALGSSRAMVSPVAELQFTTFTVSNPRDNYLAKRMGLFADCNVLDGIPKVNGFFSLYPRASGELVSTLYGSTNAGYPRICDFMAVSHSTSSGAAYEWLRRTNWLPLITAGQVPVFLDSTNQLRAVLSRDFDFQSRVVLPLDAQSVLKITNPATAKVLASRFRNQAVDFEVETSAQTLCVVAQTWFPHWRAWVDGQPVKLWRANFAFQALEIPPGRHKVRLAYRDTGFAIGAAISAVTLAICALSWWRLRRNREAPLSP